VQKQMLYLSSSMAYKKTDLEKKALKAG